MDHRRLFALDLNLLVVLDALLSEKSVSRAGKRVGMSQPAMSRALARLRELFADELLVRSGRLMLPTPRATRLAPLVRRQLHALHAVFEPEQFEPSRSNRTFTIAATDYTERVVLTPLLSAWLGAAPSMRFTVRPAVDGELTRADTGEIDLGIAPVRAETPGLLRRELFRDPYVLVRRAPIPAGLTRERYADLPTVQVSPDGHGASAVDEALGRDGLVRPIVYRTPTFASALSAVAASDLVATLPSRVLSFPEARGLKFVPLPFLRPLEIHLVRHERFAEDPANQWLTSEIVRWARTLGGERPARLEDGHERTP